MKCGRSRPIEYFPRLVISWLQTTPNKKIPMYLYRFCTQIGTFHPNNFVSCSMSMRSFHRTPSVMTIMMIGMENPRLYTIACVTVDSWKLCIRDLSLQKNPRWCETSKNKTVRKTKSNYLKTVKNWTKIKTYLKPTKSHQLEA
jgi:hypothetical protein